MRKYIYVFVGGAAGGLMRVMAVRTEDLFYIGGMDNTILLINIAGAFLLGLFLSGTSRLKAMSPGIHLGIAVGFFGSLTTFSTLTMEAVGLYQTGNLMQLSAYVVFSCLAGVLAAGLGFWAGTGQIRDLLYGFPSKIPEIRFFGNKRLRAVAPAISDETEEE